MKRISDDPVCFMVSLKKVKKYGLSPLDQLERSGRHPDIRNLVSK